MKQVHIVISGFVQGVGFRQFIQFHAKRLGLAGWVKNTDDQRVEAIVQGERKKIEDLIKLCKKGPMLSKVEGLQTNWEQGSKRLSDFLIIQK